MYENLFGYESWNGRSIGFSRSVVLLIVGEVGAEGLLEVIGV
jgi:hypothetical protein